MQIASKRPAAPAGFLLLLCFGIGTQPGCRCQRTPPAAARDGGAAPAATAWLAGSVVDRRARPVPEARVLAFALAAEGATPFEASTDLEGRFRFAHIPAGAYRLLVEAAGFPTTEKAPVSAPSDDAAVRVDGEGRSIVGRVSAAGAAVAGARVLLAPDGGGPLRETVTRAGGGFAFGGLGAGQYAVRAVSGDAASSPVRAIEAGESPARRAGPARAVGGPRHRRPGDRRRRRRAGRGSSPHRDRHGRARATTRCPPSWPPIGRETSARCCFPPATA